MANGWVRSFLFIRARDGYGNIYLHVHVYALSNLNANVPVPICLKYQREKYARELQFIQNTDTLERSVRGSVDPRILFLLLSSPILSYYVNMRIVGGPSRSQNISGVRKVFNKKDVSIQFCSAGFLYIEL